MAIISETTDAASGSGTSYSLTEGDLFQGALITTGILEKDYTAIPLDAGETYLMTLSLDRLDSGTTTFLVYGTGLAARFTLTNTAFSVTGDAQGYDWDPASGRITLEITAPNSGTYFMGVEARYPQGAVGYTMGFMAKLPPQPTAQADTLFGSPEGDEVRMLEGDDLYDAAGGADIVFGDAGDDSIFGGSGADTLHGDAGADSLMGDSGADFLRGGGGADTLLGGTDNDYLNGQGGGDLVDGGAGDDTVIGGGGRDTLLGGAGDDALYGGNGRDTLTGGAGDDTLTGGANPDTFLFTDGTGADVITDFTLGEDMLDLSTLTVTSLTETPAGDALLHFVEGGSLLLEGLTLPEASALLSA